MAIKRSAKSRSTPSHKPASSAPLRHVDIRTPKQMAAGDLYVGWLCKNRSCGQVLAIVDAAPAGKASAEFGDGLIAIHCPHCGNEDLYRWSGRSELAFAPKPPAG